MGGEAYTRPYHIQEKVSLNHAAHAALPLANCTAPASVQCYCCSHLGTAWFSLPLAAPPPPAAVLP